MCFAGWMIKPGPRPYKFMPLPKGHSCPCPHVFFQNARPSSAPGLPVSWPRKRWPGAALPSRSMSACRRRRASCCWRDEGAQPHAHRSPRHLSHALWNGRAASACRHRRRCLQEALRAWCEELGVPTFAGTSGRVFPKSMKTSPLLRAWLRRLASLGVEIKPSHRWLGWDETGALRFETRDGEITADGRCHHVGPRRGELAASRVGRHVGRDACGQGRCDCAARAFERRFSRAVVGYFQGQVSGPAVEARRAELRRLTRARGEAMHHQDGHRGWRLLCAVDTAARRRSCRRERRCFTSTCVPTCLTWPSSSASRSRAASNRWRRSCARPCSFHPPISGCCRRPLMVPKLRSQVSRPRRLRH